MKIEYNPEYKNNLKVTEFIEKLPSRFEQEGSVLFSGRNVIKSFVINPADNILKQVVVKRYKFHNAIQRIAYSFFRASKAARAFHNAAQLRTRGIDTPREIAYIEEWKSGLFTYGYFITGFDGAPGIAERLTEPKEFDRDLATDFARFAAHLHSRGILHHDLNSTNVLYHSGEEHYRFSIIDINRMKLYPLGKYPSDRECMENLTRFCGRMDLFEHVAGEYVKARGWAADTVRKMIRVKKHHDRQWERRKAFLKKITFK